MGLINIFKFFREFFCFKKNEKDEYNEYKYFLDNAEELAKTGSWKWNINTGELVWTNGLKQIYDITDVSYEEYMSKNHPDDIPFIKETIDKCIKEKSNYIFTHRLIVNDNIKYLYAKGQYVLINNKPHIIGVGQDVTEQKLIELDLIDAKNKAENASKMKSDFVANMSHEIRTPINGIIGMANLLKEMELPEEAKECNDIIFHSSGVLLSIINNVLDFSKIEAGKITLEYTNFYIKDLLEQKKLIFGQRIREKNLSLNIYINNNNIPDLIYSDNLKIKQILTNLINNAIKFTEYGSISIIVTKIKSDDKEYIQFSVKDTGIGIDECVQKTLFQPFIQGDITTTKVYGGTGLGLSICKSLVDILKGTISMKSTQGIGTTITFTIPLEFKKENDKHHLDIKEEINTNPIKNEKLIIIIEDNRMNQIVTKKTLEKLKFNNYKIYENGEKFLDDVYNLDKIDLILMDLHMPRMDGYTCTRKIRELGYKMPIIASTANAMSGEREKCLNIGMNDFLLKPAQLNEFKNIIYKWLN
jgi:signal transduction histidine kinase/CheY-like chemotaxis protein